MPWRQLCLCASASGVSRKEGRSGACSLSERPRASETLLLTMSDLQGLMSEPGRPPERQRPPCNARVRWLWPRTWGSLAVRITRDNNAHKRRTLVHLFRAFAYSFTSARTPKEGNRLQRRRASEVASWRQVCIKCGVRLLHARPVTPKQKPRAAVVAARDIPDTLKEVEQGCESAWGAKLE